MFLPASIEILNLCNQIVDFKNMFFSHRRWYICNSVFEVCYMDWCKKKIKKMAKCCRLRFFSNKYWHLILKLFKKLCSLSGLKKMHNLFSFLIPVTRHADNLIFLLAGLCDIYKGSIIFFGIVRDHDFPNVPRY